MPGNGSLRIARIAFWLLGAVLVCAPLPLGSVGAVSIAVLAFPLAIALLFAIGTPLRRSQIWVLGSILAVALFYVCVLHEQLASAPWLHFAPHPLWEESSRILGSSGPEFVTIAQEQPVLSSGLALVCFLSFTTALILGTDAKTARQLIRLVGLSGFIYAILAMLTFAIEPSTVLFLYEKRAHVGALTSPFVNRNTAAVFYGTCALIWLSLACELLAKRLPEQPNWSRLGRMMRSLPRHELIPMLAGWFACALAMFLTGSRAGAGISVAAMVGAAVFPFWRRFPRRHRFVLMVVALLGAAMLFQLIGGSVGGRFSSQGLSDEGRLSTYRATWRAVMDFPWLGTGIGTFEWLYPSYRTDDISMAGIWDRAHNSWLELAAGGGLLLAGLIITLLLTFLAILAYGIRSRRRDRILPATGFFVLVIAAVHSSVDFSLQIPGYAIVVSAILGCSVAQSFRSQRPPLGAG